MATCRNYEIDITEGHPANDPRVVQYKREIKQLKRNVELQTELNRNLEKDKNQLQSDLDSYKRRCSDLQKTVDDKDEHLNEVMTSLTQSHINIDNNHINNDENYSLIEIECNEMEFKIKNASKDKLRNYIRCLYNKYHMLHQEKNTLFAELIKVTHNMGWTQRLANNKEKEANTAKEKEKSAKNHIKSLEKSLQKEQEKIAKYKISFQNCKQNEVKKRKLMLLKQKKLKHIISTKDEFIESACSKLIVFKHRLSLFEVPVFKECLSLISPSIQELTFLGNTNIANIGNDVELQLVKYPATREIYLLISLKQMNEILRYDFAKCINIEKNQINTDFTLYFQSITLIFRSDNYEKVLDLIIKLQALLEQHSTNIEPELPPPPKQTVTDQMNIFFGGF